MTGFIHNDMGRNTEYKAKDVIEAIKGTGGIKTAIAQKLGVSRHTVDAYLARWATARNAYSDEVERVGDLAESKLIDAMKAGDVGSCKWYLARVRRGKFAERQEITGAGGQPIPISIIEPIKPDADEQ